MHILAGFENRTCDRAVWRWRLPFKLAAGYPSRKFDCTLPIQRCRNSSPDLSEGQRVR